MLNEYTKDFVSNLKLRWKLEIYVRWNFSLKFYDLNPSLHKLFPPRIVLDPGSERGMVCVITSVNHIREDSTSNSKVISFFHGIK